MDAFVAMRRFMVTNAEVFQRLSTMEYHQLEMQQHQQDWMWFAPFGDAFSLLLVVRRFHDLRSALRENKFSLKEK